MKTITLTVTAIFLLSMLNTFGQTENTTGALNTTTVKTMSYLKNGSKMPYTVKIQEQRLYKASFEQNDTNSENWKRTNRPAEVTKVITIQGGVDKNIDRVLVLRYQKQLNDTFELVSTEKGFAVHVKNQTLHYAVGEGVYFENIEDQNFFLFEEFDMVL